MITALIINKPPTNVAHCGTSPRKRIPRAIPYTGCTLLMILAVVIEKYLKVSRNSVCPKAAVKSAKAKMIN